MTAIEVQDLTVSRGGRTICRMARLAVADGERVCVRGGNGSGKTTLLRVLAGLERRYRGRVQVAAARGEAVFVHQAPYLFRGNVRRNVEFGLRAAHLPRRERRRRTDLWLERLDLRCIADQPAGSPSAGETRRAALARAMALEPDLLLLDEPLADLDARSVGRVKAAMDDLSRTTVVIASPVDLPADWELREVRLTGERERQEGT